MKKIIILLLLMAFVVNIFAIQLFAEHLGTEVSANTNVTERKIYSNPTLDDEFADDSVLVVLNSNESLKFKSYSKSEFEGLNVKWVNDLSSAAKSIVKSKVEEIFTQKSNTKVYATDVSKPKVVTNLEIGKYNQILQLELQETGKDKVIEVVKELEKREDVLLACPDYAIHFDTLDATCDGTLLESYHISSYVENPTRTTSNPTNDPYIDEQWALHKIQVFDAWDEITNNNKVLVGVLDSGIDGTHPDLNDNINFELSMDFTCETPNNETATEDDYGHGTMVAGILAAEINNGIGISGVSPNAELVSLRVYRGADEVSPASAVIDALDYATDNEIKIINASIAWYQKNGIINSEYASFSPYIYALEVAIENYDGLFICGAANMSGDIDGADESYPSEYDLDNILSVGASTQQDTRFYGSSWGQTSVDVFAPGLLILTCHKECSCQAYNPEDSDDEKSHYLSRYHFMKNTSSATPFVTGLATMLLAEYPYMDANDLKQTILMNVDDSDDGVTGLDGLCVSEGRLNAYKAINNPICIHDITYINIAPYRHTKYCEKCAYTVTEDHTYDTYENYTSSTHRSMCILCLYIKQSFHVWISDPVTGGMICQFCGAQYDGSQNEDD